MYYKQRTVLKKSAVRIWSNPEKKQYRITFELERNKFIVVKKFSDKKFSEGNDVPMTMKYWVGDYDKTVSYWNTNEDITNKGILSESEKDDLIDECLEFIIDAINNITRHF